MSPFPSQPPASVTVRRKFNIAPERAFDPWLDPHWACQFLFKVPGQVIVHGEIDAQVGGSFLFVARRDDAYIDHIGKYLEIDRPRRLVFTLSVPAFWTDFHRVTMGIVPLDSGCEVTVTHEGNFGELAGRLEAGWVMFLDGLEEKLQAASAGADSHGGSTEAK